MREWASNTADRILSLSPSHVLELGCGTGTILTLIAGHCKEYLGIDFSRPAIDRLKKQLEHLDLQNVTLLHRDANDFSGLNPDSFDLVIINSVVQYFPDNGYLLEVLRKAVNVVRTGGKIFIGT